MDENKRKLIEELAKAEHAARIAVNCLAACNTYGLSYDEQCQLDVDYAMAVAGHNEAYSALHKAQQAERNAD